AVSGCRGRCQRTNRDDFEHHAGNCSHHPAAAERSRDSMLRAECHHAPSRCCSGGEL
ncbi:hypothetical protein, partial [Arthrobacter sp. DR-2P]